MKSRFTRHLVGVLTCIAAIAAPAAVAMAGNPLVEAKQEGGPFAGVFMGGELKLELTYDAATSQYAGSITLNVQSSFPCSGKVTNGKLEGTFVAAGKTYKFDAKLDGDNVTLTSDGASHVLKRAAGVATPPAPAAAGGNPLAPAALPPAGTPAAPGVPDVAAAAQPAIPAWMKAGTRITFWSGSATIPGSRQSLEPDENGNWVDATSGQRFSPQDINGGGASGYIQLTINDTSDGQAVCASNNWLIDANGQGVTTVSTLPFVIPLVPALGQCDYWMNPETLKAMPEQRQGAVRIFRMQYPLNGKTYNVVRLQTKVGTGWTQHTYDLDSGIAISIGSCTQTRPVMTPGANGQAQAGDGATMITQAFLVGTREVKLPWIGLRIPREMANLKQIKFTGASRLETQGVGTSQWPVQMVWDINKMSAGYAEARVTSVIDYQNGMQPIPDTSNVVLLTPSFWIDPRVLAGLKVNEILDEDPVTKAQITARPISARQLAIVQQTQLESTAAVYDTQTGEFIGATTQTRNGLGTTTYSVQVSGKR